jgi:hypothetical protein
MKNGLYRLKWYPAGHTKCPSGYKILYLCSWVSYFRVRSSWGLISPNRELRHPEQVIVCNLSKKHLLWVITYNVLPICQNWNSYTYIWLPKLLKYLQFTSSSFNQEEFNLVVGGVFCVDKNRQGGSSVHSVPPHSRPSYVQNNPILSPHLVFLIYGPMYWLFNRIIF